MPNLQGFRANFRVPLLSHKLKSPPAHKCVQGQINY